MEVIKFDGYNVTYAKDQSKYLPLPAHKTGDGKVTSCWRLSFFERLKVLFTGKIWVRMLSFNKPLSPIKIMLDRPFLEKNENNPTNA